MELKLERPLLFFDIESTGLSIATDCIAELSFVKVFPGGETRIKTWRFKPWDYIRQCQYPINPQASAVNGIKDSDLEDCPRFMDCVDEVLSWITDSDLAGFNSAKFDLPMLAEEIERVRVYGGRNDLNINLHDKLMELGSTLVVETVEGLIQKNVELRVQRSFIQGSELLKPAPKLTHELQHIDWNDTTRHVYNLIRGLSPFPCAYTELVPEGDAPAVQLKVFFGEMRYDLHAEPGTVLSDGKTYFAVATQDGAIAITDLQLAGKKRMDVRSFLLGFRNPTSYRTTPGTSKAEIAKAAPKEDE